MLDDVFDKLDNVRVAKLMSLVSDNVFGQVFVTDTDKERVEKIFNRIDMPFLSIDMDEIIMNTEKG